MKTITKSTQYISNKGQITLLFSNFTIVIFAIVIVSSILFILSIQQNYYGFSKYAKQTNAMSNTLDIISANPHHILTKIKLKYVGDLEFNNKNITFEKENKKTFSQLMHANLSEISLKNVNCLQIENEKNSLVISKC